MGNPVYDAPVENISGAIQKGGPISRQKHYRLPNGQTTGTGKKEFYRLTNPRNFREKPLSLNEANNHELFRQAAMRANEILAAAKPGSNPTPNQLAELNYWQQRFIAQIVTRKGSKPDPDAPIDPKTGKPKRYVLFAAFIRAFIYLQLKKQQLH